MRTWTGKRAAGGLLLLTLLFSQTGCQVVGLGAYFLTGGEQRTKVGARYENLNSHSFAVLVSADERTLYDQPNAPQLICRAVTRQLIEDVPGVKAMDPGQLIAFQRDNPYWETLPYGELTRKLNVERLIHIDLVTWSLHEPGDSHVWQGVAMAQVHVIEQENSADNAAVFTAPVECRYPTDRPLGVLDADPASFQLNLLKTFSVTVSRLFHDHEVVQPW